MPPHPLTNFEMQRYYKCEPEYNGVYPRNNLSKIKSGTYLINPDEYESIGTQWIAFFSINIIVQHKKLKSHSHQAPKF